MFIKNIDATNDEYVEDSLCEKHKPYYDEYSEKFDYDYTIFDCCLVRTTPFFPFAGIIQTPINAFGFTKMEISGFDEALSYIFEDYDDEEKLALFKKYEIVQRVYRETSHFTINGLVSNHLYGKFDGNPFIIVEPLKNHIMDKSLESMQVEDTYFKDDVHLSDEAAIIIRADIFEQIKDLDEYQDFLTNHKVYTFTGNNEQLAVSTILNELGYDSFIVNNHGYTNGINNGAPASKMYNFISNFALNNNIKIDSHFYSTINAKNNMKMFNEAKATSIQICKIICKALKKDEKTTKKLIQIVHGETYYGIKPLIDLINEYGLDNLEKLVNYINEIKLAEIDNLKKAANSKKM